MPELPKAIFVGPAKLGDAITQKYAPNGSTPMFNFVAQVGSIPALWDGLYNNEIDGQVQAIFTTDYLFDPNGEGTAFEELVATMAPHCILFIFAYKPEFKAQIQDSINAQYSRATNTSDIPLYYFIDKSKPTRSITESIRHYTQHGNPDVISALLGRTESQYASENPQNNAEETQPESYLTENVNTDPNQGKYLGKVLAVTSSKGGSGKSTVAITTATYLSHASINSVREGLEERPLKIVLLDLDVRDGQLGFVTGHMKPTVIKIRHDGINEETVAENTIHDEKLKIDLLLAPRRPRMAEDTPPEFYLELIQFLKERYDYVILDTSVNYLDPLLEKVAYPIADQIVFVTDIVVNSVFSMTRWIQEVTKPKESGGMGIPRKKIGIIVNKTMTNINMDFKKIEQATVGVPIVGFIPNNAKLMAHSANIQSMDLTLRHSDIRAAFKRLTKAIVGRSYKLSENPLLH